ncbi:hypothetical protein [Flammeovirga kamogawensis]|uniref:N-acetyltransferase domain-containing protein n=1 Tax=Flammeovirga kamogawensis TaxID=373891 RepID=A0ABX8H2F6_9BACT|nr:hypothetical protein [Flammeovirga kamogawensis]MBB6462269.1 hypothetical protein [Flammeovirga kamogawensis]QWG09335.1 hypothetical protein KM029_22275 [Flammeovirga kamogawensis]TRX64857.1 hypothetical protein EO216_20185 [Flammeovirga kamogawensis]
MKIQKLTEGELNSFVDQAISLNETDFCFGLIDDKNILFGYYILQMNAEETYIIFRFFDDDEELKLRLIKDAIEKLKLFEIPSIMTFCEEEDFLYFNKAGFDYHNRIVECKLVI